MYEVEICSMSKSDDYLILFARNVIVLFDMEWNLFIFELKLTKLA